MVLTKIATYSAEQLSKSLAMISGDAEISGYLVGLVQDTKKCVEENLKNRPNNDTDDVRLINEILEYLDNAKTDLSLIMTSDIRRWTDK